MRKLFLSMLVSLDGFIEGPNRELDWFEEDADFQDYCTHMLRSIDLMLFGRVAYELMLSYWPAAGANPQNTPQQAEWAHHMNSLPKIVFSRTLQKAEWNNTRIVRDDIANEICTLKQQPGKDIALFAGAQIASTFVDLDLIDEYRLILHPLLLGGGTPLFKGARERKKLKLLNTRTFSSGVVVLYYSR
jgi:dihydrofolate reductase